MSGAGSYRDPVQFERKLDTGDIDDYGNPAEPTWQPVLRGVGWLRETIGKEEIAAGRMQAPSSATLRIRCAQSSPYREVTESDRVIVRGAAWNIRSAPIDPDGLGRSIEFRLERGGPT